MSPESKAYKRLVNAAVDAADRLQRGTLKVDQEAGNRLLKTLVDLDIERSHERRLACPSFSGSTVKSPAETAAAVASGKGTVLPPWGGPHHSPLPSSPSAPVGGQI